MLNCVKGYKIKFDKKVIQKKLPLVNCEGMELKRLQQAINSLLEKGAIEPCKPSKHQFLSSYFLVPKLNSSFRFILNLKRLNEFIKTSHFKMEDIKNGSKINLSGVLHVYSRS